MKTLVKIIMAALFVGCLFPMPYGYFQLIRFVGMATFVWLAYLDNAKNDKTLMIIWIASALLINPFIKIALGRTIWNIVDIVFALVLVTSVFIDKKPTNV